MLCCVDVFYHDISHALKDELMPAIIHMTGLQIPTVGVGSPSSKYSSNFMYFDFQLWRRTVDALDSKAASAASAKFVAISRIIAKFNASLFAKSGTFSHMKFA